MKVDPLFVILGALGVVVFSAVVVSVLGVEVVFFVGLVLFGFELFRRVLGRFSARQMGAFGWAKWG